MEPYYIMWELPGSNEPEFVLMLPFTPKNRQVSIGWIAGMSDGDNYGRFLAYKFPKEKRVLGPQQVETKIDQFLSSSSEFLQTQCIGQRQRHQIRCRQAWTQTSTHAIAFPKTIDAVGTAVA